MKVVDALPNKGLPEELAAIRWLLWNADENEALRNSAARKLLELGEEHFAADLTEMLWDERETPKWRNYCVQFLKDCYDRDRDPAVLDTIFKATEANQEQVRSCAIWGLARIATPRDRTKAPDETTRKKIRAAALAALREKGAHFLITTAGVQSCARLGLKKALPDIRNLAADEGTKPTYLRVVALAALGNLGDDSDLPLLQGLAANSRGQLKSAAALATKKIKGRAGSEVDRTGGAPTVEPGRTEREPDF